MRRPPRTMSTQHPDNVSIPFFASSDSMGGEDEITEAYYAFSHLGCQEQMWDFEGKEVDQFVVRKLLSRYNEFFTHNPIGKDVFLTVRVPNPSVETTEGKVLLEVLESIPRSFDVARLFYGKDIVPMFEIILPMTRSSAELERVRYYYETYVSGKGDIVFPDGKTVKSWIGKFAPKRIEMIPLFEDMDSVINCSDIVDDYIKGKDLEYIRVFLARSDPALNYGHIPAVLSLKVALYRLEKLEKKWGKPVYPIVGVGSCPFRGNLKPLNIESCLRRYPNVQTFTIQSAFKYDYPPAQVIKAMELLNEAERRPAIFIDDESSVVDLAHRISRAYRRDVRKIAPTVSTLAAYVPSRRLRKLHIGLFGYSRGTPGLVLPRAITFCASLYSVGFPPELMGLSGLRNHDIDLIKRVYPDFLLEMSDALKYFDERSLPLFAFSKDDVMGNLKKLGLEDLGTDKEHKKITGKIIEKLRKGEDIKDLVLEAAWLRRFLG